MASRKQPISQPKNDVERKETLPLQVQEMCNNANRMGSLSLDELEQYPRTECPCGHEAFLRNAKPMAVVINGVEQTAFPRRFSEKSPEAERSFGWGLNGQTAFKVAPTTKAAWEETQEPIAVTINGVAKMMLPKAFSTGSVGWYLSDKIPTMVGDWAMMMQVGLMLTINKSKDMGPEAQIANWKPATLGCNLTVVGSKGR